MRRHPPDLEAIIMGTLIAICLTPVVIGVLAFRDWWRGKEHPWMDCLLALLVAVAKVTAGVRHTVARWADMWERAKAIAARERKKETK
jgi:hypothetical protein